MGSMNVGLIWNWERQLRRGDMPFCSSIGGEEYDEHHWIVVDRESMSDRSDFAIVMICSQCRWCKYVYDDGDIRGTDIPLYWRLIPK